MHRKNNMLLKKVFYGIQRLSYNVQKGQRFTSILNLQLNWLLAATICAEHNLNKNEMSVLNNYYVHDMITYRVVLSNLKMKTLLRLTFFYLKFRLNTCFFFNFKE